MEKLKNEKANKSIVSDAWQAEKTYEKGAYCIYNDNLYKALMQTTAEPTSGSDWQIVNIMEIIRAETESRLKNSLQLSVTKEEPIDLSGYRSENYAPSLLVFGREDTYYLGIKDAWNTIITVGARNMSVSGTMLSTTSDTTITGFIAMA